MTTTVIINAHLDKTKEVRVTIQDHYNSAGIPIIIEEFSLQDGETAERYVYDGREICVQEVGKNTIFRTDQKTYWREGQENPALF